MADRLISVSEAIDIADGALLAGVNAAPSVLPTGFELLDTYLGGGLRGGELCLVGGPQGLGKTAFVLQIARYAASVGESALVLSYEHDAITLIERLISLEAAEIFGLEGLSMRQVRDVLEGGGSISSDESLEDRLVRTPGGVEALGNLRYYADRLLVHRSSGASTGLANIRELVDGAVERTGLRPIIVVDYLQKVHSPDGGSEDQRTGDVVAGLKDIALHYSVPVLAVVAADKEGMAPGHRLRAHNLRGSSVLAYEADILLIMNEKYDAVARHHLVYDSRSTERYRDYVVLSIEKNRSGLARIDLQLRKRLSQSRFDRDCEPVPEELTDDRVFTS